MNFKLGSTTLTIKNNSVFIKNKQIDLNDKNITALKLFLTSNNEVITKEKLMQELWEGMIVSDDSLFKVIQELRKLFKSNDMGNDILINVYGKGYKIRPAIEKNNIEAIKTALPETRDSTSKKSKKRALKIVGGLLITTLIVFSYWNLQQTRSLINDSDYLKLTKLIKKDPDKVNKLLDTKFNKKDLTSKDQAIINVLKGRLAIKKGNFKISTELFLAAILLENNSIDSRIVADSYNLLGWINTYTNKPDLMKEYIEKAAVRYSNIGDEAKLLYLEIQRGRHFMVVDDVENAIKQFNKVIEIGLKNKDSDALSRTHMNLAVIFDGKGMLEKSSRHIEKALEISIESTDPVAISLAYSFLATNKMKLGDYSKSSKYSELSIRFAMEAKNTNLFQQTFSSLYNNLSQLGHNELAEKYLKIAIDFQNSKNDSGHLIEAEMNLGILFLKTKRLIDAHDTFRKLLSYELTEDEERLTTAWLALTRYYQSDNISAYTLAKDVYINLGLDSQRNTKLIAGISIILSGIKLEREQESYKIFEEIKTIKMDNYLIEKSYFLDAATEIFKGRDMKNHAKYLQEKQDFTTHLSNLKLITKPKTSLINQLNTYIDTVFMPQ